MQSIHTDSAPAAVGPYSQAIVHGDTVFTAGQIGIDPATGQLVGPETAAQLRQVLKNLCAVLEASGSSRDKVIKSTIFLVDLGDYAEVNQIYGEFFGEPKPARSTVQVAALPAGARVEIELVAAL